MALRINHKDNSIQFNAVDGTTLTTPPVGTAILYVDSGSGLLTLKNDGGTPLATLTAVIDDTSPQLGGDLDVDGNTIIGAPAADLTSAGGELLLNGAEGGATSGSGAKVRVTGGGANSTSNAGGVNVVGGAAAGSGQGGNILIAGGTSSTGTGGSVFIASGDGGSIGGDIELAPDGPGGTTGDVHIRSNNTTAVSELQFYEARNNGGTYIGLKVPAALTNTVTWTLPVETHANASGKFITAAAADGVLSFATAVKNPMVADLSVGGFLVKQSASTYLDLDDTTTVLHTGGILNINSVGNTNIKPDNAATGLTVNITGGQGTAGAGGDITLTPGTGSTTDGIVTVAGDLEATGNVVSHIAINPRTANYTLLLTDDGKMIQMNNSTNHTITIPANGSVAFPIGTQILFERLGTGTVTFAITTDTLNSAGGLVLLASQYSTATIIKTTATRWLLMGDLA